MCTWLHQPWELLIPEASGESLTAALSAVTEDKRAE